MNAAGCALIMCCGVSEEGEKSCGQRVQKSFQGEAVLKLGLYTRHVLPLRLTITGSRINVGLRAINSWC